MKAGVGRLIRVSSIAVAQKKVFGVGLQAVFMLKGSTHDRQIVDRFMAEVATINEVRAVFLISGQYDVLAHVVVRDTDHLRDLALDEFTTREGVDQIEPQSSMR